MGSNRKRADKPKPVSLGVEVMEDLPFPYVYYPNHYGTFFAFAEDANSEPVLCACSRDPIDNLLRLTEGSRHVSPDNHFFPDVVVSRTTTKNSGSFDNIRFVEGVCHRCNLVMPTWRYCHEMYGTRFVQHFGWYINQQYLRLGILPTSLGFLEDVCPPEIQELIRHADKLGQAFQEEEQRLKNLAHGPPRKDISPDEITYWRNVREEEAQEMISLRRKSARARRKVTKKIENIVREEFGFKRVGEAWVSETLLYQLVCRIFRDRDVIRHHRPEWLDGLELDIYVPSLGLAFEYQGQQHFNPVDAWGGEAALAAVKERDRNKALICKRRNIELVTFHYTEPLTEEQVRLHLQEVGVDPP